MGSWPNGREGGNWGLTKRVVGFHFGWCLFGKVILIWWTFLDITINPDKTKEDYCLKAWENQKRADKKRDWDSESFPFFITFSLRAIPSPLCVSTQHREKALRCMGLTIRCQSSGYVKQLEHEGRCHRKQRDTERESPILSINVFTICGWPQVMQWEDQTIPLRLISAAAPAGKKTDAVWGQQS